MADQVWKRGDTRPALDITLDFGRPAQTLTGATQVKQHMKHRTLPIVITSTLVIVDAATRKVRYTPIAGDTDDVGDYDVEYETTWSDGGIETTPNDESAPFKHYKIIPDLA